MCVGSKSRRKLFNFFFIFFWLSIFTKTALVVKKKAKRSFVVLRAPFHFKLSKHHIMYQFYNIYCSFIIPERYHSVLDKLLSDGMIQSKTFKKLIRRKNVIDIKGLIL